MGYGPWGHKKLDTTEAPIYLACTHRLGDPVIYKLPCNTSQIKNLTDIYCEKYLEGWQPPSLVMWRPENTLWGKLGEQGRET